MDCPFCALPRERVVDESQHTLTIRDAHPVSPGHTLVIPKRHVRSFFDATDAERLELWAAIARARGQLEAVLHPDGWNVGLNDGEAAGQTVMHLHLIPRFHGDVADPRGGVRHCVMGKGYYESGVGKGGR